MATWKIVDFSSRKEEVRIDRNLSYGETLLQRRKTTSLHNAGIGLVEKVRK